MPLQDVGKLTVGKFCDDTEISLCLKCVQHLDNVLMPKISQDLYLLPQVLDVLLAFAMFHDELHGSDLSSRLSAPLVNLQLSTASTRPWSCFSASTLEVIIVRHVLGLMYGTTRAVYLAERPFSNQINDVVILHAGPCESSLTVRITIRTTVTGDTNLAVRFSLI